MKYSSSLASLLIGLTIQMTGLSVGAQNSADPAPSNSIGNLFQGLGQALQKLGAQGQNGKPSEGVGQNIENAADQSASPASPYKWTSWANRTFAPEVEEEAVHLRVGYSAFATSKDKWQYYPVLQTGYQTCDLIYLFAIYSKSSLSEQELFDCGVYEYVAATIIKDGIRTDYSSKVDNYLDDQYNRKNEAQRYAPLIKERMAYLAKAKRYYVVSKPSRVLVNSQTNVVDMTFEVPHQYSLLNALRGATPLLLYVPLVRAGEEDYVAFSFKAKAKEDSARMIEFARAKESFGPTKISFSVIAANLNKFGEKTLTINKLGADIFFVNPSGAYMSSMFKFN